MITIVICIWMFSIPAGLKLYSQDMFPWYCSLSENNSNGCHSILCMLYSDSTADTYIAKPTVVIKHQSNSVSFSPVFVPSLAVQLGRSRFYCEITHQAWKAPILSILSLIIVALNRKPPSKSYRVRRRGGCELVNTGSAWEISKDRAVVTASLQLDGIFCIKRRRKNITEGFSWRTLCFTSNWLWQKFSRAL